MLEIGTVINDTYKILNVVGRGGTSIVYLAMNERANRQWAIKEILKKDFRDFVMNKKEISMMKRLNHPNLPGIVDVIEWEGSLLIVMEYIEGRSLEALLEEQGPQPERQVIAWARELCDVLLYLHTRRPPIIYRDMKPGNIIWKPDGHVALIDFGAAREYNPQSIKDTISLGTRGYAAPEQYEAEGKSDARTDIYCLGVTLFQLVTGENPYRLQPIRNLDPGFSAGLEAIICKCTQIKKEDRYQSVPELLYALEHYWELDFRYRAAQKKKLVRFLRMAGLSLILGICAAASKGMELYTRNSNYEACLLAAQNSVSKADEIENYKKAIRLDPSAETAYLNLLEEGFLDDMVLTAEESECLRAILIDYGNGSRTYEQIFRENEKGYARFAYKAGVAYFYQFEEKSNKKNARGYFEIALRSDELEEKKIERVRRLYAISDYYTRIGIVDEAGDDLISYRMYWDDLTALSQDNLVELDNERTALVVYGELLGQIVSRTLDFKDAGVEREEMETQVENVKQHLNTDFAGLDEARFHMVEKELEMMRDCMEQAEKQIRTVYEEKMQEE